MNIDYATLEKKLERNYDELRDPTILSDVRNFFHQHPDPAQERMPIILIKRLTKMASHVIDDDISITKTKYSLGTLRIARKYCTEGINKILRNDIENLNAEYSFLRNMHSHLHAHAAGISLEIAAREPSTKEKANAFIAAFKHAHRAVILATENNDKEYFIGYSLIKRANAAKGLAELAEEKDSLKWREIAAEDYKEGAQKIEKSFPINSLSPYAISLFQEYKIAEMYEVKGDAKEAQRRTQNALDLAEHLSYFGQLVQTQPPSIRQALENRLQFMQFDIAKHNRRMYYLTNKESFKRTAIKLLRRFINHQTLNNPTQMRTTDYARQLLRPLIINRDELKNRSKNAKLSFKRTKQDILESELG